MELRSGYKQTEAGVIPEDWDTDRLGNKTTKVGSGITPTGGVRVYKQEGRPFLRSQNVGWGNLLLDDIAFIDDNTHATFQDTEIEADDVFLNITGASIGRSAVADARVRGGNVNQHVCIIRTDQAELHPRFLNYFLLSTAGQRQIDSFQAGGNRQGLNFGQVRSFRLPLPPPIEQRAIAEALSDADAHIESLKQLIAKKSHLKQGAMQELLTGKKRLPGFEKRKGCKKTEVGIIPEDWEVKPLGCIASIATGNTPPTRDAANYGDEFLFASPVDLGFRKYITRTEKMLSKKGFSIARPFPKGSVLFVCIGSTIGKCGIASETLTSNQQINAILPSEELSSDYLYYAVSAVAPKVKSLAGEQAVPIVNKTQFSETAVPLPPTTAEQEAIGTVLSDMDAEIAALESELAKARQIKQGMMQELLTGRIRLL